MKVNIIAEVGSNHMRDKGRALELIAQSAAAGADVVKFQLFTADTLWSRSDDRHKGTTRVELPPEWIPDLIQTCEANKVKFLCTPFSPAAVDLLESHGAEAYKISSGDVTYLPLIEKIGKTRKPVYLSVGGATIGEINAALKLLPDNEVVILHCVPGYPVAPSNAFIRHILNLGQLYYIGQNTLGRHSIPIGLSSHLREWWVDVMAIAYHVHTIEKHVDLIDRAGPEAGHSLDTVELSHFVRAVRDGEAAMADRPFIDFEKFSKDELYARANYRRNPQTWVRPYVAR